jgi:PqqD family protein of HPr-rel-A system
MAEPVYRVEASSALRSAVLDGLSLVYHRPSGQTHIMVEPMPDIMEALGERPMSLAELAAEFSVPAEDHPLLQSRLDELLATGLIAAR